MEGQTVARSLVWSENVFYKTLTTGSSPQWWPDRSTTTHIVLDLRRLIWGFGGTCTMFIASFCNQSTSSQMCPIDIYVVSNQLVEIWKVGIWTPSLGNVGSGKGPFNTLPIWFISLFSSYLADSKSSHPSTCSSDLDTVIITALEAIA